MRMRQIGYRLPPDQIRNREHDDRRNDDPTESELNRSSEQPMLFHTGHHQCGQKWKQNQKQNDFHIILPAFFLVKIGPVVHPSLSYFRSPKVSSKKQ